VVSDLGKRVQRSLWYKKSKRRKETENSIVHHMQHVRICYLQAQSGQGTFPYHHRGLLTPTRGSCALGKHARSCSRIHAAADAERSSSSMAGRIHTAAADAVLVFIENENRTRIEDDGSRPSTVGKSRLKRIPTREPLRKQNFLTGKICAELLQAGCTEESS